jgi:hypothetical protein
MHALALVVAVVPVFWMRQTLTDALPAAAIGWFVVSLVLFLGLLQTKEGEIRRNEAMTALASGVGFAATVCAVALLGAYRGTVELTASANAVSWSALGLTFAAGIPFFLLLTALPTSFFAMLAMKLPLSSVVARISGRVIQSEEARRSASRGWRLVFCVLLMLGLGKLMAMRVSGQPQLLRVLIIGLVVGLLAWWLTATRLRQERENSANAAAIGWQYGALAILVVLAGSMVAYQMLAGIGVGLVVTAAWLAGGLAVSAALEPAEATSPAADEEKASLMAAANHLTRLLLFGLALLLYRVFVTRFENHLRGVSLTDYYAVFGFLSGAVLPAFLAGFLLQPGLTNATSGSRIFRLVVTGALTLCVPAFILVLWGAKCALALFIGLALGIALTPQPPLPTTGEGERSSQRLPSPYEGEWSGVRSIGEGLLPALLALAVCLALTQWTHQALALALLSRAEKIHILTWSVGTLIALILVADYGGRIGARLKNRKRPGTPVVSEGAAK